jgi:hypothetical protein
MLNDNKVLKGLSNVLTGIAFIPPFVLSFPIGAVADKLERRFGADAAIYFLGACWLPIGFTAFVAATVIDQIAPPDSVRL